MNNTRVQGETLAWLLEPDPANPSVRYFTLRDLLDRPEDQPEVRQAKAEIMRVGTVPAILAAQDPEGYWVKSGSGYSPKYRGTVWQVIFLAELGADPLDERVRRGCQYLLSHSLAENGAFSCYRPPSPRGALHCLNGNLHHALIRLGQLEDSRVQSALDWQVRAITGEGEISYYPSGTAGPGFACGVNLGQPCGWGAVKALKALIAVPEDQRSRSMMQAIETACEFLLSRDPAEANYPYTGKVSPTWFKLGFPLSYWSDILEIVEVLVEAG
jgi:hypothetical protein